MVNEVPILVVFFKHRRSGFSQFFIVTRISCTADGNTCMQYPQPLSASHPCIIATDDGTEDLTD